MAAVAIIGAVATAVSALAPTVGGLVDNKQRKDAARQAEMQNRSGIDQIWAMEQSATAGRPQVSYTPILWAAGAVLTLGLVMVVIQRFRS